ncbi:MAG: NitT/TauT family transport system substrate-binding protein, partial [Candidatus Woesearchaeota archaeon]
SEDQTIESLQNVGVLPGSFSPIWATHALKVEGNTQVDMQAISPKLQLAALESKQVDALITVEPLCTFGKNKGTGVIIMKDPMKLYAPTVAGSVISSKLVNQKPAFAKKLIRAHDKAIDFIEMNPQEAKLILIKYTKYDEQLSQGLTIPDLQKSDEINDAIIQQFANRLFEDGVLGQPMNTNELILSS